MSTTECLTAQEMRVGPSESDGRIRLQTAGSCLGTMVRVVSVPVKRRDNPSGVNREGERE